MPCVHGQYPSRCRAAPCKGSEFCWDESHNNVGKQKAYCKECKGSGLCWDESHNNVGKQKAYCKECKGSGLCWDEKHNNLGKLKQYCKGCKGPAFCWDEKHNNLGKIKQLCKGCKGSGLCWDESHNNLGKNKQHCKGCKGSALCWDESHNNLGENKQLCKGCKGSRLCKKHLKLSCRECDPIKHLTNLVRAIIRQALKTKTKRSLEYLGCSGEVYRSYLEKQFKDGMTWENHGKCHGKWNIDHITPLMYIDENGNPPPRRRSNDVYIIRTRNLCGMKTIWKKEIVLSAKVFTIVYNSTHS